MWLNGIIWVGYTALRRKSPDLGVFHLRTNVRRTSQYFISRCVSNGFSAFLLLLVFASIEPSKIRFREWWVPCGQNIRWKLFWFTRSKTIGCRIFCISSFYANDSYPSYSATSWNGQGLNCILVSRLVENCSIPEPQRRWIINRRTSFTLLLMLFFVFVFD